MYFLLETSVPDGRTRRQQTFCRQLIQKKLQLLKLMTNLIGASPSFFPKLFFEGLDLRLFILYPLSPTSHQLAQG